MCAHGPHADWVRETIHAPNRPDPVWCPRTTASGCCSWTCVHGVPMYTHMTCVHVCTHTVCTHVHICTSTYVHTHVHMYIGTCAHIVHIHTCVYITHNFWKLSNFQKSHIPGFLGFPEIPEIRVFYKPGFPVLAMYMAKTGNPGIWENRGPGHSPRTPIFLLAHARIWGTFGTPNPGHMVIFLTPYRVKKMVKKSHFF